MSHYAQSFKILLLGDSGVGKSCIILRYIDNNFSQNLMNSIGVDFKLKNIDVDGKKVKLQIVSCLPNKHIVGYSRSRKI